MKCCNLWSPSRFLAGKKPVSDSECDSEEEGEVVAKKPKRQSTKMVQNAKRASEGEVPASRNRTRSSDPGAIVSPTSFYKKVMSQNTDRSSRARRSDSSSKENRNFDDDIKQVCDKCDGIILQYYAVQS